MRALRSKSLKIRRENDKIRRRACRHYTVKIFFRRHSESSGSRVRKGIVMKVDTTVHTPIFPRRAAAALLAAAVAITAIAADRTLADDADAAAELGFSIGDSSFSLSAPEGWQRVQPRSQIVEAEFAIPGEKGLQPGRMTVMGAGGSIEANIERWFGQFGQPDGSATKDRAAVKKTMVAGCKVTLVDISGIFRDMPGGPFAGGKTIERPDYQMLAAIVETPSQGNYFIKFYGPAVTVAEYADGFQTMVEGLVPAP